MNKTKVLIADDHAIVATGVKAILDNKEFISVVGIVENGIHVLEFLEKEKVDIILMDINMPEMNGVVCTKKVKERYPEIKVIVLTMYKRKQFIRELIEVGADGCILKSNSGKELMNAIDRVQNGSSYFDQMGQFVDAVQQLKEYQLSEREIEVIELIAEGHTSKEISERLFISEHTVKTHRKNIFRKLNIKEVAELIQFAMDQGIS